MRAFDGLLREAAAVARAIARAPVALYRWFVDHAPRCIAALWLAGMAFVVVVMVRRIIKLQREEAALVAAVGPAAAAAQPENGDGPPQVVEMMDVDEMNDIQNERMHALGLAAAGDSGDPDEAAIDAARTHRGETHAAEGTQVGGAGNLIVVSKGGIAGWIQRNKGKKPDPETLAWLRGEEKADGRAAYAGWVGSGDGDLMSWLVKNQGERDTPVDDDPENAVAEPGSGSGSAAATSGNAASGGGSANAAATTGSGSGAPIASAPRQPPPVDLYALGTAAIFGASPTEAVERRRANLAALRTQLSASPATHALEPHARGRHVAIALPEEELFGADGMADLTPEGTVTIRRLGAILAGAQDGDVEIRGAADRALEIASQLVIAGLDPERLALAATTTDEVPAAQTGSAAHASLEVILLESR